MYIISTKQRDLPLPFQRSPPPLPSPSVLSPPFSHFALTSLVLSGQYEQIGITFVYAYCSIIAITGKIILLSVVYSVISIFHQCHYQCRNSLKINNRYLYFDYHHTYSSSHHYNRTCHRNNHFNATITILQ